MAKLVSDVTNQARYILNDEDPTSYRYPEDELVAHVNNVVGEVKRLRPDYFDGKQDEDLPILDTNDEFPLDPLLFVPSVFYVTGMAELVDDEHANSGRAAGVLKSFYTALNGPLA